MHLGLLILVGRVQRILDKLFTWRGRQVVAMYLCRRARLFLYIANRCHLSSLFKYGRQARASRVFDLFNTGDCQNLGENSENLLASSTVAVCAIHLGLGADFYWHIRIYIAHIFSWLYTKWYWGSQCSVSFGSCPFVFWSVIGFSS